jgi:AraC family transcriptional regulator
MKTNAECIATLIDLIEEHLTEEISLDDLAAAVGYSKYHLHRMFSACIGFPVHQYIQRRRLTEAARRLLFSDDAILDIAVAAGYESQQAFTLAFKEMYKKPPLDYRRQRQYQPIQLKFSMEGNLSHLRSDRIMDIKTIESQAIHLHGFKANTRAGFFAIPMLWNKLHRCKNTLPNRTAPNYLVGLNRYGENFSYEGKQPVFDYYAAVEVSTPDPVPPKMEAITLPAGKYVVFTFRGKTQDSLQPVMDHIYKTWLPESTCRLNEQARYDLARYGEITDEKGQAEIEVWLPIL